MRYTGPNNRGVPLASQFEDGRMGLLFAGEGAEVDWTNAESTGSTDFATRCMVVQTAAERYYAVGEEVVAFLGTLDLGLEPPSFTVAPGDKISAKAYPEGMPGLVIGAAWAPAIELGGDASAVELAHIDWRKDGRIFMSPAMRRFDYPNYFDRARQILSAHEPMATEEITPAVQDVS